MTERFPVEDNMYNINLDNMTVTNLIVWKDEKIKEDLKQGFVTEKFKKEIRPITSNIGNIITAEDNDVTKVNCGKSYRKLGDYLVGQLPGHTNHPKGRNPYAQCSNFV
jgi:hypothetical protein